VDGAFRVGDWQVEPQLNLIADGNRTTHLEPKVMRVLVYLADHADQVISKERLIHAVWPDTFVTDDVLTHAVSELRRVFGDDVRAPRYIQTIPKGGYRLIALFTREEVPPREGLPPPALMPVVADATEVPRSAARTRAIVWVLTLMLVAGAAGWLGLRVARPTHARAMHLAISIPAAGALGANRGDLPVLSLSPDGTRVAYVANSEGKARLYLRALHERDSKPISGTEGAYDPFFAPDGESIGFAARGKLKKVSLSDGNVVEVCDAPTLRGAAFTPRGTIVFAPTSHGSLWAVPAGGGKPVEVTRLDFGTGENSHRWPEVLPDGKTVIFTIRRGGSFDNALVAAVDLETGQRQALIEGGTFAQYASTGHLVYGTASGMLAVPFDPIRLRTKGPTFRILDGVVANPDTGAADFSLSRSGSLAYVVHGPAVTDRTLVRVDEHGVAEPILPARRGYEAPRVSPDGRQIAVTILEGSDAGIWILDPARGALSRFMPESGNTHAVWHPNGHSLAFSSSRAGPKNLFCQATEASHAPERLTTSPYWQWPTSWSPDGRLLAYTEYHPISSADIWILDLAGGRRRPFMVTAAVETGANFSPDGRSLAYVSDESGTQEVYVRSYPHPGPRWQVSTDGGTEPVWDPSGGMLFYRNKDRMMAVDITTRPSFAVAKPRVLFEGRYLGFPAWDHTPSYDVARTGHPFIMIKDSERATPPTEISIVLNWFDELTRAARVN
jgi:Tol biopolymer transport system component/DNA-binding winged helix-turn-helix (wHTH) protein